MAMQSTREAFARNDMILAAAALALIINGWPSLSNMFSEKPHKLSVEELYFQDGKFIQRVEPKGTPFIQGEWSASIITPSGEFICGGGGNGPYTGTLVSFTPDDWTGGNCSRMVVGREYVARATWVNMDQYGEQHTIAAQFDFIHEMPSDGDWN